MTEQEYKETLKAMENFEEQSLEERLEINKKLQNSLKKGFEEGQETKAVGLSSEILEKLENL